MSLIAHLADILEESRAEYEKIMHSAAGTAFRVDSLFGVRSMQMNNENALNADLCGNMLASGDNTAFMRYLMQEEDMTGKVQLIYIDPPFFSKANYGSDIKLSSEKFGKIPPMRQIAYTDSWQDGTAEYLKMLCIRFYMMHDLLADEGCLWVHLDWHIVHYIKVLLDEIFGEKNFINEVIWNYKSGGSSKKHYARKHDTLLFYAKSPHYYFEAQKEKSYNRGYKPYRFKGVKEYRDEKGWYTMVNMKDVWQLDMVGRTSSERTGYATQKPEALIERILGSCTREGDIVCDFFGGSGTLASAAEKMKRKWIYCDLGSFAAASAKKRLVKSGSCFSVLVQKDLNEGESDFSALGQKGIDESGYGGKEKACTNSVSVGCSWRNAENTCDIDVRAQIAEAGVLGGTDVCCATGVSYSRADRNENLLLTVALTGYNTNENSQIPVDERNLKILHSAMNKDPLRFIDFWSVDYSYDGKIHRADEVFLRDKEQLQLAASHIVHRKYSNGELKCNDEYGIVISVKAHDIFGNTAERILSI